MLHAVIFERNIPMNNDIGKRPGYKAFRIADTGVRNGSYGAYILHVQLVRIEGQKHGTGKIQRRIRL